MGKAIVNHNLLVALDLAARLKEQPELVVAGDVAKLHLITLADAIEASQCYKNAQLKGRETFCLTSDDNCAPEAIDSWAGELLLETRGMAPGPTKTHLVERAVEANKTAQRWRVNPDARLPD